MTKHPRLDIQVLRPNKGYRMTIADPINVLLVEDNDYDARYVQELLSESSDIQYKIKRISTLKELQDLPHKHEFEVILLDLTLPDAEGIETITGSHSHCANIPIVIMSGMDNEALAITAVQAGAQDYLVKGYVDSRTLIRTIRHAMERNRLIVTLNELNRKQAYLATHDSLTHLPNRQLFQDRLKQEIAQSKRYHYYFALLFLDLDGFKSINDSLGHDLGDELLICVADRLKKCVRDTDTVARIGGDEFTLILSQITHPDDASKLANNILQTITSPFTIHGKELYISASLGIAVYPNDGIEFKTLLKNADAAMYFAKERGRNNYQYYASDINTTTMKQLTIGNSLRRAIEQQEFELYYQPQINTATGETTCLEALIRWTHPELGLLQPNEFITIAENTGTILPIGNWVLQTACQQHVKWCEQNLSPPRIAVNLAAQQFEEEHFVSKLIDMIEKIGLQPKQLALEITESNLMRKPENMFHTLEEIKELGIQLCIDDFGTGYSSLSYLKRFPLQTLKIDQSFIRDLNNDQDDTEIVKAIINLASSLDMDVIAEGVENEHQEAFLIEQGCHNMQGFLYSPPLSTVQCTEYLKNPVSRL